MTKPTKLQICTLLLLALFTLICFCPLHCFYLRTRKQIGKTLWHILISPFGLVRFRHFFLADVLTSMITPLQMLGVIYCFYLGPDQDWKVPQKVKISTQCPGGNVYYIAMGFIPYWFRFLQCLNKRYYTGSYLHLLNAGKYFSDMLVPFAGLPLWFTAYDHNTAWWVYFWVHMFASTYSYIWDIKMDFGLCRYWKRDEKWGLREKLMYPVNFYWYMIVSDLILRFVWIFGLYRYGNPSSTYN